MNDLDLMLSRGKDRGWIVEDGITAYVRVTQRAIHPHGMVGTIDVANVTADERGKGALTRWLSKVEQKAQTHGRVVFAESVLETRLEGFLARRGYTMIGTPGMCPSFYKEFS